MNISVLSFDKEDNQMPFYQHNFVSSHYSRESTDFIHPKSAVS